MSWIKPCLTKAILSLGNDRSYIATLCNFKNRLLNNNLLHSFIGVERWEIH